jgi:phosphate transport system protein
MDLGLERLTNMLLDMGELSQQTIAIAVQGYVEGKDLQEDVFQRSEQLRLLQDEATELAVELIARYQPVASDLRFLKSGMEIAYGFSRFGRYAFDIADVLKMFGDVSMCNHAAIQQMAEKVKEMVRLGVTAFASRDVESARTLEAKDDAVDELYREYVHSILGASANQLRCAISDTLVMRYLERIADHANYIGESVRYIVTGERAARR